ncbi:MAG: hypothetical protein GYA24_23050 [Candidatus Lokiarchaeota archaeon]|nr:hypothetical protein [Candidatus Lokiarchaeota archaeon]
MSAKTTQGAPAPAPWDSAPIIGYGKRRATMRPEEQDTGEKGKLELVASGLQFTGTSVTRIPFEDIRLKFNVKGTTDRFGITTRHDKTYYFKTFDASGFVAAINQLQGDPSLRKTGGVPGTPAQVAGLGLVLALAGPGITIVGILGWIFLPGWFAMLFIGITALGVVLAVLGIRAMTG